MNITITLTGPDGAVVAIEDIVVTGETVPYELVAVREFEDLPMGTYRVTVTGVKTGGGRGGTAAAQPHPTRQAPPHSMQRDDGLCRTARTLTSTPSATSR
ncbi:hypothetical protein [Streptomyces chattanoogensis]|uniref:hypothetical protein n=1 Tax=Streptomyces chattanoogensis TaxID=66876 RepID=UPI0036A2F4A1